MVSNLHAITLRADSSFQAHSIILYESENLLIINTSHATPEYLSTLNNELSMRMYNYGDPIPGSATENSLVLHVDYKFISEMEYNKRYTDILQEAIFHGVNVMELQDDEVKKNHGIFITTKLKWYMDLKERYPDFNVLKQEMLSLPPDVLHEADGYKEAVEVLLAPFIAGVAVNLDNITQLEEVYIEFRRLSERVVAE